MALDHFLQEGTQAPSRSLQALKRISKHAEVELELANLHLRERARVTGASRGQAPVAEPLLVEILEERVEELFKAARWL